MGVTAHIPVLVNLICMKGLVSSDRASSDSPTMLHGRKRCWIYGVRQARNQRIPCWPWKCLLTTVRAVRTPEKGGRRTKGLPPQSAVDPSNGGAQRAAIVGGRKRAWALWPGTGHNLKSFNIELRPGTGPSPDKACMCPKRTVSISSGCKESYEDCYNPTE